MKKLTRMFAWILSLALVFGLAPAAGPQAAAAATFRTVYGRSTLKGGFQIGTYADVAAVWEDAYYNPVTGEMLDELPADAEDSYTGNYSATVSRTASVEDGNRTNAFTDWLAGGSSRDESAQAETNYTNDDPYNDYRYQQEYTHEDPGYWVYKPMYLVRADEEGLHRVSCFYAELTGISETGHLGAKDFQGHWGVIDYTGKVIYDFEYSRIEDMEGYIEPRTTRNTSTRQKAAYMTEEPDTSAMSVVIREENEKLRVPHYGYAVVEDKNGDLMVVDGKEEKVLPTDGTYYRLSDVSSTGFVWAGSKERIQKVFQIDLEEDTGPVRHGDEEYIYDEEDPGEEFEPPVELLDTITDIPSAVSAVNVMTERMTEEQKASPSGIDIATQYAEAASMRAADREAGGDTFYINAALLRAQSGESNARAACSATEKALADGGVITAREMRSTVVLMTDSTAVHIQVDPDVLGTQVDAVRIETPDYALTLEFDDMEEILTEVLTIDAESVGEGYAPSKLKNKSAPAVKVAPSKNMNGSVKISQPVKGGGKSTKTVTNTNGTKTISNYNKATGLNEAKINEAGTYVQQNGTQDFSDIASKSAEMQKAIRSLVTSGVIEGTSPTTFSPDGSIGRAEIAMMIVKALGKNNKSTASSFVDVARGSWYYSAAANSQKLGYIKGYEDRTFRGLTTINRVQIVSVSARVLQKEMRYKAVANTDAVLAKYKDRVDFWAQKDVAMATKENLVVYRWDGTFSGQKNMSRGDAAILLYRLFKRLW